MTLALHGKSKRRQVGLLTSALMAVVLSAVGGVLWLGVAGATPQPPSVTGAVNTSTSAGTVQNGNTKYTNKCDVYLRAAQQGNSNLGPDGTWYIKVTDPSGATLLTPNPPGYITAQVLNGKFVSYKDFGGTSYTATNDVVPLCAVGTYSDTPNAGGEYKAWASISTGFADSDSKTDNFKVGIADPTILKSQSSQVSDSPANFYWSIGVNNPAAADQTVQITDSGATFVAQTSPAASGTCTGLGVDCTVKANQTLVIRVSKAKPAATCNTQTVSNTAVLSVVVVGKTPSQVGSSTAQPDYVVGPSTAPGCNQVLARQVTIKKIVDNAPGDTTSFAITKDGTTSVGSVSVPTPLGPLDLDSQTHTFTETVPAGYSFFEALLIKDTLNGDCQQAFDNTFSQVEAQGVDPSIEVPGNTSNYTVCFVNIKTTSTVTVKKVYTLHGGTKEVPVMHVDDGTDHTPGINAAGQNDATHSEWVSVPVVTTNGAIFVSEDIDTSKWFTNALPTISGTGCSEAQPGQVAAENIVGDPGAVVLLDVSVGSDCVVTFHNEEKQAQVLTRKIRIGKVTTTATHPQEFFTGTIAPGTPGTFSVNLPANQSAGPITDYVMANQNGQVVTETNVPANWTVNGYTVKADTPGNGSCSPTESYSGTSANVPSGSGTYLVCIRNTYTPPSTPTPTPTTPVNPCPFGCVPVILNTPTPTPPPPTPTVVPPTPTVVPPTATPTKTPVEAVEGAKTPGAIATPLAPSTGSGLGDGGSSTNLFLALIGILSLSGGLALLGYGRRAR